MAWHRPVGGGRPLPPGLVERWTAIQVDLRARRVVAPLGDVPRFVAGADAAFINPDDDPAGPPGRVVACAVVYDRVDRRVVEVAHAVRPLEVPYVPTFLSFREGPAVAEAVGRLTHPFGAVCFDGQGYAHPRRCGLAVHLGVTLDVVAVGCGKSRLIGTHDDPGPDPGDAAPLAHAGEVVGTVLRTKPRTNPVYVSAGHRIDLPGAVRLLMACVTRYRVPEPTRLADVEVAAIKKRVLAGSG